MDPSLPAGLMWDGDDRVLPPLFKGRIQEGLL